MNEVRLRVLTGRGRSEIFSKGGRVVGLRDSEVSDAGAIGNKAVPRGWVSEGLFRTRLCGMTKGGVWLKMRKGAGKPVVAASLCSHAGENFETPLRRLITSDECKPGPCARVGCWVGRKTRQNRFHSVFNRFCPFTADTAHEKKRRSRGLANHATKTPIKNGENRGNGRTNVRDAPGGLRGLRGFRDPLRPLRLRAFTGGAAERTFELRRAVSAVCAVSATPLRMRQR
jgi:hypothetical protein